MSCTEDEIQMNFTFSTGYLNVICMEDEITFLEDVQMIFTCFLQVTVTSSVWMMKYK